MIVVPLANPEIGERLYMGTVEIMGHTWRVVGYRGTDDFTRGTNNLGYCINGIQVIGLCMVSPYGDRLPDSEISATFVHELLHAVSDYANAELSEEQVNTMANVLFQVFQANPEGMLRFEEQS